MTTNDTISAVHQPVKEVVQVDSFDFDCYLDGEYIGSRATREAGETFLSNHLHNLLSHNSYYPKHGYVACLVDQWPVAPKPNTSTPEAQTMPANVATDVPTKLEVVYAPVVQSTATFLQFLHTADSALKRALERAARWMPDAAWTYEVASGVLAITSRSQPRVVHYASVDGCDCPTTKGICWHRASTLICHTLAGAGVYPVAPLPLPEISAQDSNGEDMSHFDRDAWGYE